VSKPVRESGKRLRRLLWIGVVIRQRTVPATANPENLIRNGGIRDF
jgi:hypothetical protein